MSTFRLLHASDLHFRVTAARAAFQSARDAVFGLFGGSSHNKDSAEALARLLHTRYNESPTNPDRKPRYHAAIVTGDVADVGSKPALDLAFEYLGGVQSNGWHSDRGKPVLRPASGLDVYLLPGNHDRFLTWKGEPGGTQFDAVFREYWDVGQSALKLATISHDNETLSIIAADFTLPAEDGTSALLRFAQGDARAPVLDELHSLTEFARNQHGGAVLWAIHFSPAGHPSLESKSILRNEDRLAEKANALGVTHVLCGHLHQASQYDWKGVRVLSAGSACAAEHPNPFCVHDVELEVEKDRITRCTVTDIALLQRGRAS